MKLKGMLQVGKSIWDCLDNQLIITDIKQENNVNVYTAQYVLSDGTLCRDYVYIVGRQIYTYSF